MKKYFTSPFFAPLFVFLGWVGVVFAIVYSSVDLTKIVKDGQIVANFTYLSYFLMIIVLLSSYKLFFAEDKKTQWIIYVFLAFSAVFREMGIQKYLSSTDSTPFKSRFFLDPKNPILEKIVYGAFLLFFFSLVLYLIIKSFKYLFKGFFAKDTISWSVATFSFLLVVGKFFDRLPSNFEKHADRSLDPYIVEIIRLIEEVSEIFLPLSILILLIQYIIIKKQAKELKL